MLKYKYNIGQEVSIQQYDRWIGDYTCKVIIQGYANYVNNGVPVYTVKEKNGNILNISETNIIKND